MAHKITTNADAVRIADELKERIANFAGKTQASEFGIVREVGDGIATIAGLRNAKSMELLRFSSGVAGVALNLEADHVGAMILGSGASIVAGDEVSATGEILSVRASDDLLGRVVDPLGVPLDGKGVIKNGKSYPVERIAPGVMTREPVNVPLMTGIKAIDALIPIGRGQRELIIGDRQTGKTAIAIDTIINQKGKDVVCVYVAIGQKESKVARIVANLEEQGAMEYTFVVMAGASSPASMQYLAPYGGVAMAEFFMDQGKDVLVIYDDLSKHAVSYREVSLLLGRPPGREAYPGDVFYLHSRLLERACRRNAENGGGSITALPIIETQAGDVSAYIPTNVISITDGQIYLEGDLFYKGVRPAVNAGLSVSRVGSSAQFKTIKKVAGTIKLDLAQFRELEAFSQFASDLDEATRKQIDRGRRIVECLKQDQNAPFSLEHQVALLYAVTKGYLDSVAIEKVKDWEKGYLIYMEDSHGTLLRTFAKGGAIEKDQEETLKIAIGEWNNMFSAG